MLGLTTKDAGFDGGVIFLIIFLLLLFFGPAYFFVQRHKSGKPLMPSADERAGYITQARELTRRSSQAAGSSFARFTDGGASSSTRARTTPMVTTLPTAPGDVSVSVGAGGYVAPEVGGVSAPLQLPPVGAAPVAPGSSC